MNYAGVDIGSRTIEVVVVNQSGEILESRQADTTFDPISESGKLLEGIEYERIMATGYGRTLFEIAHEDGDNKAATVTEIKAHACGARAFFPNVFTILDIGGQDSKSIAVNQKGRVEKFEMNDRCAAGTGKFLEIMAGTLGFTVESFGDEALKAGTALTINSMCTVFAESEVTSLIARGAKPREIALGLHVSVMKRAAAMVNRVRMPGREGSVVFTGGVAKNPCMVRLISEKLGCEMQVAENPQMVGALGAALLAREGA